MNLEPACVIVCPTQAILAGDLDNPRSRVSHIVATQKVSVRKPGKGTQPKLFYVGIEGDLLEPTRISRKDTYFAADRRGGQTDATANDGINLAGALAREVYDVPHPAPWGWKIAAYLWTKAVAAGALLVAAILPRPGEAVARAAAVLLGLVLGWALLAKCVPALYGDYGRIARLRAPLGYWNELALLADVTVPVALWLAAPRGRRAVVRAAGALLLFGLAAFAFETRTIHWSGELVFAMAWLVLVLSIAAVGLMYWLIRRSAATGFASLYYLVPVVTALLAFALFGEKLDALSIGGMVVCAAGVILVNRGVGGVKPAAANVAASVTAEN